MENLLALMYGNLVFWDEMERQQEYGLLINPEPFASDYFLFSQIIPNRLKKPVRK